MRTFLFPLTAVTNVVFLYEKKTVSGHERTCCVEYMAASHRDPTTTGSFQATVLVIRGSKIKKNKSDTNIDVLCF